MAVVLACLALLFVIASADGEGSGSGSGSGSGTAYRDPEAGVAARVPDGWRALARPIDSLLYPPQVFAAASFPVQVPARPDGCTPTEVLDQMPAEGVLLEVVEYTSRDSGSEPVSVPGPPQAPRRFRYRDAVRASFECAGPSYRFVFERGGRAFQAQVWLHPDDVDRDARAQALRVLDSFRPLREA